MSHSSVLELKQEFLIDDNIDDDNAGDEKDDEDDDDDDDDDVAVVVGVTDSITVAVVFFATDTDAIDDDGLHPWRKFSVILFLVELTFSTSSGCVW